MLGSGSLRRELPGKSAPEERLFLNWASAGHLAATSAQVAVTPTHADIESSRRASPVCAVANTSFEASPARRDMPRSSPEEFALVSLCVRLAPLEAPLRRLGAMPSQVQAVLRNLTRASDGEARGGNEATRVALCSAAARGRDEGVCGKWPRQRRRSGV
jgi:hypothetical protein